jgi:(E)-4-hydroxy-3-methylbut-2-enyl-diphosphate synthase
MLADDSRYARIPEWTETTRDFMNFSKRKGDLPAQIEGDSMDVRGMMHRDGSVFSCVTIEDLKTPDTLYRALGAKMVVGLPFKDIATSDSIYLPEVPTASDAASRKAIKRLQDVAVGVIAPIDQLQANPLTGSVAVVNLADIQIGLPPLPEGSVRYAVRMTGLEPEASYNVFVKSNALIATSILEVSTWVFIMISILCIGC